TIKPEVLDPDDVEMLQDLVVASVNEGFRKANDAAQQAFSGLMGGLGNIPNMFG
ncbi:MAG TPA: YbaB/EbfC family nucleoid-associated protein, partial [bacterium]|nr:YbaB/EbfC family nucleoid-associated protein [bacterium]